MVVENCERKIKNPHFVKCISKAVKVEDLKNSPTDKDNTTSTRKNVDIKIVKVYQVQKEDQNGKVCSDKREKVSFFPPKKKT